MAPSSSVRFRAWTVATLVALACGCDAGRRAERRLEFGEGPRGLVMLCVDTLRFDALPLDESRGRMPRLEAFARTGARFAHVASTSSWTGPAIASALTGLLPSNHGGLCEPFEAETLTIASRSPTLAEVLVEAGFDVEAITGAGFVSPEGGLQRGFPAFRPTFDSGDPRGEIAKWDARRDRTKRFFLFLHTYAAHEPYGRKRPEEIFARVSERAAAAAELRREVARLPDGESAVLDRIAPRLLCDPLYGAMATSLPPGLYLPLYRGLVRWRAGGYRDGGRGDEIEATVRDAYRAGLAHADAVVGEALDALRDAGLPDDTVVVVFGDHGEAFGEHGRLGHGFGLEDEVLRVPLAIRAPGRVPHGAVVRGPASLADLMPTVLDLLLLPTPAEIDGVSLLPLVDGSSSGRPVVAEAVLSETERGTTRLLRHATVRTRRWKYLLVFDPATGLPVRDAVFDLLEDRGEERPLDPASARGVDREFCEAITAVRRKRLRGGLPLAACE